MGYIHSAERVLIPSNITDRETKENTTNRESKHPHPIPRHHTPHDILCIIATGAQAGIVARNGATGTIPNIANDERVSPNINQYPKSMLLSALSSTRAWPILATNCGCQLFYRPNTRGPNNPYQWKRSTA